MVEGRVGGGGLKPWQLQSSEPEPTAKPERATPPQVKAETADLLELAHGQESVEASVTLKKSSVRAAIARASAESVKLDGDKLRIGGREHVLSPKDAARIVLLPPNAELIAGLAAGIQSQAATVISAPDGAGASTTTRWFLEATKAKHEVVRVAPTTTMDALAGAMRPDARGKLSVVDGPLARAIRDGGVMVVDALENAQPDVLAVLKALAKGAKWFHHPVSGEPIPVHRDFRLVLIARAGERLPKDLVGPRNLVHVPAYSEADRAALLHEKEGLPVELAGRLSRFHAAVEVASGEAIDYGRGFPLGYGLLERAARRIAAALRRPTAKPEALPQEVAQALFATYGARLPKEQQGELVRLLTEHQFPAPIHEQGARGGLLPYLKPQLEAKAAIEGALRAGEVVCLRAPGQSGATRLVGEIARSRKQELVTIVGHANTDPQLLLEMPSFDERGRILFRPGRVTEALLEGKLLYVDHVDQMSPERQSAFYNLGRLQTISVVEDGKVVEKKVHAKARIVLGRTEGKNAGRHRASPVDRAQVTEVQMSALSATDVASVATDGVSPPSLAAALRTTLEALDAEAPGGSATKLQRAIDFAKAAALLATELTEAAAIERAATLVLSPPKGGHLARELEKRAGAGPVDRDPEAAAGRPLWMRLLGLDDAEAERRLASTGYAITPSMRQHLDALAIAYRLGRPVFAVGPASSGKTVLGVLFSALVERPNLRTNFSAATESRDLMGGLGPVNVDGKTVFRHVEGPAMRAAELEAVLIADEWNLNQEAQMALKSWIDHRRVVSDAEADLERPVGSAFLYAAANPTDKKTGRSELPPVVSDCLFHIFIDAKPLTEKVDTVKKHTSLPRELLLHVGEAFEDIQILAQKGRLPSQICPLTFTERDMRKVADAATHLYARDGVTDEAEARRILGRETYRVVADALGDPADRARVLEVVRKHLGTDVEAPARPGKVEVIEGPGGERRLRIGVAEVPIRERSGDPELDALIPTKEGIREPLGPQLELLESVLFALELGQPAAIVGATGTGKTMLVRYLAHMLEVPFREQPFYEEMTEDHLFGTTVIDESGKVEFAYAPLVQSAKDGALCCADEFLTLPNRVREKLNCFTEGTEIQISQKKPPETIARRDWHPDFRFVITTNGDDIRKDGFSTAEASRLRVIGIREIESQAEYAEIAVRDFSMALPPADPRPSPRALARSRAETFAKLPSLVGAEDPARPLLVALGEAMSIARAEKRRAALAALAETHLGGESRLLTRTAGIVPGPDGALPDLTALKNAIRTLALTQPPAGEDAADLAPLAESLEALGIDTSWLGGGLPILQRALVELVRRADPAAAARMMAELGADVAAVKASTPVAQARLVDPAEAEQAAALFADLRELQIAKNDFGASPLTSRVFSSFMELFVELRKSASLPEAMSRAAQLSLWSKLGRRLEGAANQLLVERVSELATGTPPGAPRVEPDGAWFGETFVAKGRLEPWAVDNDRFAMTPARTSDLALLADATVMGKGRPISCTDDANGETTELLREFGRLTGRPVTVVTLPPNADIEALIERLSLSSRESAASGFEPELQQIGQAVKEGHLLALRGAGNIPTGVLERLNSLGDGRMGIKLPRSGRWLKAHDDFRLVLLRKPDALFAYSPALQNRLIEPPLSTRSQQAGQAALETKAAELALVVATKTKMPEQLALKLAIFHTYLNQILPEGSFASGRAVGAFTSRDAEAVGRRFAWLQSRGAADDPAELLHTLVTEIYGARFNPAADRELLALVAGKAFGAQGGKVELGVDLAPSPHLMRLGEWAVPRDPRGVREGVPGADQVLPVTSALASVQQPMFAAFQFDEVVHLHGDDFVATASVTSAARLTTSPLLVVEGNEGLSEAYLFGGLIQNQRTGKLEHHEGVVWKAQAEGATLFLKNASRLPNEVVARLSEIAATGQLQRVKDGQLETRPMAFRLVLGTADGDPPLVAELAQIATRIRADEITDPADLRALSEHILRKVPGGATIAAALTDFAVAAGVTLGKESQTGRQPVAFDSARLFAAAREIAAGATTDAALEDVIADVVSRLYLRPAKGLGIDAELAGLAEGLAGALGTTLVAAQVEPIDFVEKPALAALRQDHQAAAPALTAALLAVAGEALAAATEPAELRRLAEHLASSPVVPERVRARARTLLGARQTDAPLAQLKKAIAEFASETAFGAAALELMRGARLWDLEHRRHILELYRESLAELATRGAPSAEARLADLAKVEERFDSTGALDKVHAMRGEVQAAMAGYRQDSGDLDEQLAQLYRRLIERWDLVATSPIFRSHHQLRTELGELRRLLEEIRSVHESRGAPSAEVQRLFLALGGAERTLEGLRIAEQSAELRGDLVRTARRTEALVGSIETELVEIRRLEAAERRHALFTGELGRVTAALGGDEFLFLDAGASVSRPEMRPDAELLPRAAERGRARIEADVRALRVERLAAAEAAAAALPPPDVRSFFADAGLLPVEAGPGVSVEAVAPSAVEELYRTAEAEVEAAAAELLADATELELAALRADEEERAARLYRGQIESRAKEVAARVQRSAGGLALLVRNLTERLELGQTQPELAEAADEIVAALREAGAQSMGWVGALGSFVEKAAGTLLSVATFGLFGGTKTPSAPPPPPDLGAARARALEWLEKVKTHLGAELAGLPDFGKVPEHKGRAAQAIEGLLLADSFGDLAARYAHVAELERGTGDLDLQRTLRSVLGRLAVQPGLDEVLLQAAAFQRSADVLSSEVARDRGVGLELAPAVEATMRAAESLHAEPLGPRPPKEAPKALRLAIARIDELGPRAPALLVAVRAEMSALLGGLERASGLGNGELQLRTDAARDMLAALGQRAALAKEEVAVSEVTPAGEVAAAPAHRRAEIATQGLERWLSKSRAPDPGRAPRATELLTIEIDPARTLASLEPSGEPSEAGASGLGDRPHLVGKLRAASEAVRERVAESALGYASARLQLAEALGAYEAGLARASLELGAARLAAASAALEEVVAAQGQSFAGLSARLRKGLDGLRSALRTLAGLERVPPALLARLEAAIEAARPAAAAFGTSRFEELAFGFASDALVVAAEAETALLAEIAKLDGSLTTSAGQALAEIGPALDRLGARPARLGAFAKVGLLRHLEQRLGSLAVPEADAAVVAELRERIEKLTGRLEPLGFGAEGEQTLSDLYGGLFDLGDGLVEYGGLEDEGAARFEELAAAIGELVDAGASPASRIEEALELAVSFESGHTARVRAAAKEIALSLGELRRAQLGRDLDRIEAGLDRTGRTYLEGLRASEAAVRESGHRLAAYDPEHSTESTHALANALRSALAEAGPRMVGPGAPLVAEAVQSALAELEERAGEIPEVKALLAESAPIRAGVDELVRIGAVVGRFERMLSSLSGDLGSARRGALGRAEVERLDAAFAALEGLLSAPRDRLEAEVDRVEAEHFPGLAAEPTRTAPPAPRTEAPKSKVLELLGAGVTGGPVSPVGGGGVGQLTGLVGAGLEGAGIEARRQAPGGVSEPYRSGDDEAEGAPALGVGRVPQRDEKLDVRRDALPAGKETPRADALRPVELSADQLKRVEGSLNQVIASARMADLDPKEEAPKTEFRKFIDANADLVAKMSSTLRRFPGTEVVFVIDQSGSTAGSIIAQERAALALSMAAVQQGEANCGVVGFGGSNCGVGAPIVTNGVAVFLHKPMSTRLDDGVADAVYRVTQNAGGGTDFFGPLDVAIGQFTSRANNKLVVLLTDAYIDNPAEFRRYIDRHRKEGVGVALMGFGDARNVADVAGEFGVPVESFADAVTKAADLLQRSVVANEGRFQGTVKADAQGIGVTDNQLPLLSAESPGPMQSSLDVATPLPAGEDPAAVFAPTGARRAMHNLVDPGKYQRALRQLEKVQRAAATTGTYRRALKEVRSLKARHDREGILESLRDALGQAMPRTSASQWERKQLSGPLFDEEQLPLYVVGLEQGVPVTRLFKRRRPKEETRLRVVLQIDESSSMGDSDKMRANLEALLAMGDSIKALDPSAEIAVVGFSDKVRLHHGFEQEWSDEAKAHLLHQVQGTFEATDDERAGLESIGLLELADTDVGMVLSFSDGQGMPGTTEVAKAASGAGFAFLTCGVGPECKGVQRFGRHGLYGRNLVQLAQKLAAGLIGGWEQAGRLVG